MIIYKDSSILYESGLSTQPEWQADLYQLNAKGLERVSSASFDLSKNQRSEDFVSVSGKTEIKADNLHWEDFELSDSTKDKVPTSQVESTTIPTELVGTWKGLTPNGLATVTYGDDGSISVSENGETKTGKMTSYETVDSGLYRATGNLQNYVMPTFNLGGAGFDMESGFKISGDILTYVYCTGEVNTDFNAQTYQLYDINVDD